MLLAGAPPPFIRELGILILLGWDHLGRISEGVGGLSGEAVGAGFVYWKPSGSSDSRRLANLIRACIAYLQEFAVCECLQPCLSVFICKFERRVATWFDQFGNGLGICSI